MLPPDQLPSDAAGVDAERVKTLKLRGEALQARIDHHRGVIGLHQPGHVHETDTVQIRVDERIVLAVVDLGSREDLELVVQIGPHGTRLVGLRGEKNELCLRVRQTPAQIDQVRSRSELPHVADPSA